MPKHCQNQPLNQGNQGIVACPVGGAGNETIMSHFDSASNREDIESLPDSLNKAHFQTAPTEFFIRAAANRRREK